jgi:hypothetical protein
MQNKQINWIKILGLTITIAPYIMMILGVYLNKNSYDNTPIYIILFLLIILSFIYKRLMKISSTIIIRDILLYSVLTIIFIWIMKITH